MTRHQKYTPTKYEFTFTDKQGSTVYTLWFITSNLTINRTMRLISQNAENIFSATNSKEINCNKVNGQIIVTAGEYIGKLTGRTNYQVNGY